MIMNKSFFRVKAKDVQRSKAYILCYLLQAPNSPKQVEKKKDVLLKCLKADPEDKAFRQILQSLNENHETISNDILLSENLIDFDYTIYSESLQGIPTYSDVVTTHVPNWIEYARVAEYLTDLKNLNKSPEIVTRADVIAMNNKHTTRLTKLLVEEESMDTEAVLERLRRRESIAISGIREIDLEMGGFSLGNLLAIGGYAGAGKTTLMCSMAYRNAIMRPDLQQAYLSLEVPRDELHMWFVARHADHPKWRNEPGVDKLTRKRLVKSETLEPSEHALVLRIADDLYHNPEYGKIHLLVNKDFPSFDLPQFKSTLYDRCPDIKVFYFDHINKLENISFGKVIDPFQRMNTYVDFLAENLSKDFYGNMILTVAGVQINRTMNKEAVKRVAAGLPPYDNNCWAGVNAIERSAYYALAVYSTPELWRTSEIAVQSLKHRIGEVTEGAIYVPAYPTKMVIGDDAYGEVAYEETTEYVDEIVGDMSDSPYVHLGDTND